MNAIASAPSNSGDDIAPPAKPVERADAAAVADHPLNRRRGQVRTNASAQPKWMRLHRHPALRRRPTKPTLRKFQITTISPRTRCDADRGYPAPLTPRIAVRAPLRTLVGISRKERSFRFPTIEQIWNTLFEESRHACSRSPIAAWSGSCANRAFSCHLVGPSEAVTSERAINCAQRTNVHDAHSWSFPPHTLGRVLLNFQPRLEKYVDPRPE